MVQIAEEDNILGRGGLLVFLSENIQRQRDKVAVIIRTLAQFLDFNHVSGIGESHIAQCEAALLINDLQHCVDVAVVEDEKALGVLYGVTVLLQY